MKEKDNNNPNALAIAVAVCLFAAFMMIFQEIKVAKLDTGILESFGMSGNAVKELSEAFRTEPHVISDFEVIFQLPQLPTGCEVTALTMVLNHYGYPASKTDLARDYLPKTRYRLSYKNGRAYGPDLDKVFVGNPFGDGTICGPEAVVTAANAYLADYEAAAKLRAKDITGTTPAGLYLRLSNGQPVIIHVTIGMTNREKTLGWYTEDGDYVDWSDNDHGSVLIGWDEETVTIACPLSGIQICSRAQFEKVYEDRGFRASVLEPVFE